ncbi:MAG: 50S ribosomal protein L21 [Gammaproteobacteria bacterium RIFOXYB2_FULL_38_6]|nr:MAG: 50S ribosomal protein L21 [Gammaproteobacteria bacterium RIFOXYB2_FULL_38_6]
MYAIIETGGKQYRITEGLIFRVEKLEAEAGAEIIFDKVLMTMEEGSEPQIGTPYVDAKVTAEVLKHDRADKVEIIKFKRRKHQMKHQGHRQHYTEIKIKKIG